MKEHNDIKNLFAEIGVSDGGYRDLTRETAQQDSLARWPLLSSVHQAQHLGARTGATPQPAPAVTAPVHPPAPGPQVRSGERVEPVFARAPLLRDVAAPPRAVASPTATVLATPAPIPVAAAPAAFASTRPPASPARVAVAPAMFPPVPAAEERRAASSPSLRDVFARLGGVPAGPARPAVGEPVANSLLQRLNRL